jgi:hypothetical protein
MIRKGEILHCNKQLPVYLLFIVFISNKWNTHFALGID